MNRPRGTDETFLQLMELSGHSLLKLLGLSEAGTEARYRFRATVFKPKRMAPDVEGIPSLESGQGRIFIEFQGYRDPLIRYRLASQVLHACLAMPDNKPIQAAIVYTDTAWQKAALPLDQLAANLSSQFREIVLTDYTETELLEVDPQLVVLSPFTLPGNLTAEQLEDKIRHWRDITQQVYPEAHQPEALNVLGLFLLNRFRTLSQKEVLNMLNLDFSTHPLWLEARQEGRQESMQQMLLEVLGERFGELPATVQARIEQLHSIEGLKSLFKEALHCADLAAFEDKLNQAFRH